MGQTNQSGSYVATHTNASGCLSHTNFYFDRKSCHRVIFLRRGKLQMQEPLARRAQLLTRVAMLITVNASGADVFDFADEFALYINNPSVM